MPTFIQFQEGEEGAVITCCAIQQHEESNFIFDEKMVVDQPLSQDTSEISTLYVPSLDRSFKVSKLK